MVSRSLRLCGFCGRLLAAALPDLVPRLRWLGELKIDDATATLLLKIAPATIDRRLKADRAKLDPRGRSHTKPGTLLKDSIPMWTWAAWDDAVPGFVEIDLVGHEGGNSSSEFCFTPDITDIATGWTETRSVRNKAQKWVFEAIKDVTASFPFPILGIDSDNGSEFINWELFRWCEQNKLTFTRSRSGNKNDGAHVEQKNWHIVRQTVGYHHYDTAGGGPQAQDEIGILLPKTARRSAFGMVLPGEVLAALMVGGFNLQGGVGNAEPVPQHVAGVVQDLMVVRLRRCHQVRGGHRRHVGDG